jgi:hypothetical protein
MSPVRKLQPREDVQRPGGRRVGNWQNWIELGRSILDVTHDPWPGSGAVTQSGCFALRAEMPERLWSFDTGHL